MEWKIHTGIIPFWIWVSVVQGCEVSVLQFHTLTASYWKDTINDLEERGVERGSARLSSLKGWERAIVNKPNTGTGVECIWVERGSTTRSSLKRWERAWVIINNTNIGTVSKTMLGKLLRHGGAYMGFSKPTDTTLSWTELSDTTELGSYWPKPLGDSLWSVQGEERQPLAITTPSRREPGFALSSNFQCFTR